MRSLIIAFCLAGLAAAQPRDPAKGVNFYSIEKEIALGRQLFVEVSRDHKTLASPAALAYVTNLGQRLAHEMNGPPFTYTYALIDDKTPYSEAIALPGGFLLVPSSLILAAHDEDELAGILAHSLAHIASRDGTKSATKAELVNIASQPLLYMGGWTGYAIRQGAALALPLAFLDMHRKQDLAADQLAVTAMSAAGYDPAAFARYVARELPRFETPAVNPLPPLDSRIERIQSAIDALPAPVYATRPGLAPIQEEVRRLTDR